MSKLQDLIDKRANAWAQAQDFLARTESDSGDPLSAEEEATWKRTLSDIDATTDKIDAIERTQSLDSKFSEINERATDSGSSDGDTGDASDEYRAAFVQYMRSGMTGCSARQQELLQERAQSVGVNADGGFTVPETFWAKVTETLKYYGVVANLAENLNTGAGEKIVWPTADGTAEEGEIVGENTAVTEEDTNFGQKEINAYMYSSKMIKASRQILQDSGIDMEGHIARRVGQRLGRITNRHFTLGTGAGQPQGVITGTTAGVTGVAADLSATAGDTVDALIDLEHSVDAAYRMGGTTQFMLHDLTLAQLRKVKDADGRPLWQPSLQAGVASTLNGHGYVINNYMDPAAAGATSIAFGDFNAAFVVRSVNGGQLLRLTERYAEFLQIAFLGFGRWDSVVQDASAVKLLTHA